jgi:hypothetical protein
MPKVELNAALFLRLEALTSKTATIEMLVNRAVDEYLQARLGTQKRGPSVRIPPKDRT